MIPGIDILSQEEILYTPDWAIAFFAMGLIFAVALFCVFIIAICENEYKCAVLFVLGFVVALGFTIGGYSKFNQPTGTYTYKVTISDDVKMNEFLEQYEIVSQEGKIYTVKLRNTEDQQRS